MLYEMYSVRDNKMAKMNPPMFVQSPVIAIRQFSITSNDKESMIGQFPEDFSLYKIGTFDDDGPKVIIIDPPELVVNATDVLRKEVKSGKNAN